MSKQILVTGASGFVGTHLIERAVKEGTRVIALDIKPPRKQFEGVTYVQADVRDLTSLAIDTNIDMIYNFAAVHTTPGHDVHEYYETNIVGALEVTKFAERHDIKDIVFTSSISVYGPSEETKTEESVPAPVSAYGYSKLMAEHIHRNWLNRDESHRLVIVRPAVVFGPGEGGNFTRLASLLKKGFFVFPGRKDTIKACIYVQDLINALNFAHDRNERYILFNGAYPGRYTLEDIVSTMIRNYFPKARTYLIPRPVVTLAAKGFGAVGFLNLGIHPERVTKLVRSTDIYPTWLESHQFPFPQTLKDVVDRWAHESQGTFV